MNKRIVEQLNVQNKNLIALKGINRLKIVKFPFGNHVTELNLICQPPCTKDMKLKAYYDSKL